MSHLEIGAAVIAAVLGAIWITLRDISAKLGALTEATKRRKD